MTQIIDIKIEQLPTNIQGFFNFFGYSETGGIIVPSKDMLSLKDITPRKEQISNNTEKLFKDIEKAKDFLNSTFGLHRVVHCAYQSSACSLYSVKPTQIPVQTDSNLTESKADAFISKKTNGIVFTKIDLANKQNIVLPDYAKVITSTQIDDQPKIVSSYAESQTIPILVELISAYYDGFETLRKTLKEKFHVTLLTTNNLVKDLNNSFYDESIITPLKNSAYITGTYEALCIFNNFLLNNNNYKKYMIKRINDIFAGIITVDEFINEFGARQAQALNEGPTLARSYIDKLQLKRIQ